MEKRGKMEKNTGKNPGEIAVWILQEICKNIPWGETFLNKSLKEEFFSTNGGRNIAGVEILIPDECLSKSFNTYQKKI